MGTFCALLLSLLSIPLVFVCAASLSPSDFLIESLPGLDQKITFKQVCYQNEAKRARDMMCFICSPQYSGYLPIGGDDKSGTELFFWFVESTRSPADDPVVLWLNGGRKLSYSYSIAYFATKLRA